MNWFSGVFLICMLFCFDSYSDAAQLIFKDQNQQQPVEKGPEGIDNPVLGQQDLEVKARPLLTFSPHLPIEISQENRQKILEGNIQMQQTLAYNQEVLRQSTFPWLELAVAFLIAAFVLAMKYATTQAKQPEETAAQRIARVRQQSLNTLEELHQQQILDQGQYVLFYETVANTVRHYVDEKYQLHVESRTTQEFLQKMEASEVFSQDEQMRFKQLFLNADLVKFAKQPPSLAECQTAEQTARDALVEA